MGERGMSDNGQRAPLPGCMIGPSEPCDAFQRQTARIAELEAALAAERERREAAEALLLELVAVVRGECPSLLDEDSGGDARTSLDIDAHFARYKKEPT